jgi:hypothetical protein
MKTIDFAVTVDGPVAEARSRILGSVDQRLRSAGFNGHEKAGLLEYRPRFTIPAVIWVVRRLRNEQVTFTFEEQGRVTEVRASGRLPNRAHAEVAEAFGGD